VHEHPRESPCQLDTVCNDALKRASIPRLQNDCEVRSESAFAGSAFQVSTQPYMDTARFAKSILI